MWADVKTEKVPRLQMGLEGILHDKRIGLFFEKNGIVVYNHSEILYYVLFQVFYS